MRRQGFKIGSASTLVIASSGTDSTSLETERFLRGITIAAPAALTDTCVVQISWDDSTYYTLQSGGSDIKIPAGKAVALDYVGWSYIRVQSASAEGAERTFTVRALEDIT